MIRPIRAVRDRFYSSIAKKFVAATTIVIAVLMVVGTAFVAMLLMEWQYHTLEMRGKELSVFLGKAVSDPILMKDILTIDDLTSEAVKSHDMLYTVVTDASGAIVSTRHGSFNQDVPEIKALFSQEKSEDMDVLIKKVKQTIDVFEISEEVSVQGAKIGSVRMGFTKRGVKANVLKVSGLLLGTAVGIVLILSTVIYFMVRRMIVAPTTEVVAVASSVASGDLTRNVAVRSNDELGALGRGLNSMIIGLKTIIMNVQEATTSVSSVSGQVKDISDKISGGSREQSEAVEEAASSVNEMHFSLKEIAGSVEDVYSTTEHASSAVLEMAASIDEVAKTMSDLSASIEETTTAITQMSAAIRQIAEHVETLSAAAEETAASTSQISASVKEVEGNARESAALAEAVAEDAQQLGMRSIEKTIDGMRRIEEVARRTWDVVNRLRERSESIGTILTVIEDITDQTGLLALNASILAAQAGEHGKGFAVVASEIRELANRTAASTQEIGKLIAAVQEETREAAEHMNEGVQVVEQGARLSRDAGEALRKILERADQSRDMSRSISKAAAEQSRGVKQVSEAVERINEMTHQIAKATGEQRTGSEQIIKAAEKMREITRFVKTATAEQAKGGKDITTAMETMTSKVGMMNRAAGEVQAGSDLIVKAIERIKAIARSNGEMAAGLDNAVEAMAKQADSLMKNIAKFRTK